MAIIDIIIAAGEWAHGGDAEEVADTWERAGFDEEAVERWLAARCFEPWDAERLSKLGVTPEQAAMRVEHAGSADCLGYWVSNGDMTARQAAELARRAGLVNPCHHCQAQEATKANGALCDECAEGDGWDATDEELLARIGRAEVRAWRKSAAAAGDWETVDLLDASGVTGMSRWESLSERAEREGVSEATVRRAIARGLSSRKRGSALEVASNEPIPPVEQTGPKHHYVVREPGQPLWWEGSTRAAAERELRRARAAGLAKARILRDGEWIGGDGEEGL